jgi:16S rRNA (adenine(1408)-N(1))-methyltransferase
MRRVSQQAPPNAVFVVAAAEHLPSPLDGTVAVLSVHFPWGSLLQGLVAPSFAVLDGISRLLTTTGSVQALLSITARDGGEPLHSGSIDRPAYARCGLEVVAWRPATRAEISAADSSWAKRLRAGGDRPVWYLHLRRAPHIEGGPPSGGPPSKVP